MRLIVGLGNPGILYSGSRHNVGFTVVKALAKELGIVFKKDRNLRVFIAGGAIEKEPVFLAMPLTFMNLSGGAVAKLMERVTMPLSGLLVICDDIDLDFGRIRIRPSGSSGGHRGLQSIIDSLGSNDFSRLRIGVGRPHNKSISEAQFVLSGFLRKEKEPLRHVIAEAASCCAVWATRGATNAMNQFNRRKEIGNE